MYDTTSRIERGVNCGPPRRSQLPWPWPRPSSYGVRIAAGRSPRGGAARRRISFWHWPWPPSYGVDVTAGGSHQEGDGPR
jgi:hypothetical protein